MELSEYMVGAKALWAGAAAPDAPCLFISARDSDVDPDRFALPPCPVIAIGTHESPLAELVDCVVPDEAAAKDMLDRIAAHPHAAAVVVDLLRLLPSLSLEQGLIAESLAYGVLQASDDHLHWRAQRAGADAPVPEGQVQVSRTDDRLTIVLDRPGADNAIDRAMRDALAAALDIAVLDQTIRRVTLRATGRSFSLGADLNEFGTTRDPASAHHIRRRTLPASRAITCADRLEVHVQGACVGAGLELAAFARRITAGPRAWFHLPELDMGVLPGAGGCVSLTRRIGRQRTAWLILSGKRLSARAALDWGLIDAIVDEPATDQNGADIA